MSHKTPVRRVALCGLLLAAAHSAGADHAAFPAAGPAAAQASGDLRVTPYAGHYNHAHAAPTFRWGWFGAEHHYPRVKWHRDYNGDVLRWTRLRRY